MNTANKQYGRLTKKGGYTKELDLKQELGYSYIYNRLSELEDKIEAGTLVAVPYAIGQKLYCVDKSGYSDVEKIKVSLIKIRHDGSIDIPISHYNEDESYISCFKYDPKYYEVFDNEAEAEKRLEEIRNEQICSSRKTI